MDNEFESQADRQPDTDGARTDNGSSSATPADHLADIGDDRADDGGGDATSSPDDLAAKSRWAVRGKNMLTPGTLTVHYVTRDVRLGVDGDAGLRAISAWRGQLECVDHLDHHYSSAEAGWVGIDLRHVVGMTWMPDSAGIDAQRITIDPIC